MSTAEAARISAPLDPRADVTAQRGRVALDLRRILAEQVVGDDVVDVGLDRVGEEERLSEPRQPLVGVDDDMDQVRELVRPHGVDAPDPHRDIS
jgi:hypothetical protein